HVRSAPRVLHRRAGSATTSPTVGGSFPARPPYVGWTDVDDDLRPEMPARHLNLYSPGDGVWDTQGIVFFPRLPRVLTGPDCLSDIQPRARTSERHLHAIRHGITGQILPSPRPKPRLGGR